MATTHPDLHSSTMASHYCNYPSVARRINALPPERLKYVKSGCFKDVIAMLVDEHSEELNYIKKVQVDRFDPSTRELDLLSGTKIRLTSQNPNLLKLSSGPYQLKQHLLETDSGDLNEQIGYVKDLYKFDLSGYKKSLLSGLWAELASTESVMTEAEFYIKFTLAFVSSFVAPVAFTKVNLDILGDIIPFQRIDTLDWDGFSIDQLAAGVQEIKERRLKVLKGCAYLIIMGDKLFRRMEGVNSQPRCSNLLLKLQDPPRSVIDCCSSNSLGPLSKSHESSTAGSIMENHAWSTEEELFVLQPFHDNPDEKTSFYKCKKDYYAVVAKKMNDEFRYQEMTESKVKDKFRDFARRYGEHTRQNFSHLPKELDTNFHFVEWYIAQFGYIFVPRQRTSSTSATSKSKSKSKSMQDLSPEELKEVTDAADLLKGHCTAPELVEYVKLLACRATWIGFSVHEDIPSKKKFLDDLLQHKGQKRKSLG